MSADADLNIVKHIPRPEIKMAGPNTILSYRLTSFYDLFLAVAQVQEIIGSIAIAGESFALRRTVRIAASNIGEGDLGIFIKFTIPKRINDMSMLGSAIQGALPPGI